MKSCTFLSYIQLEPNASRYHLSTVFKYMQRSENKLILIKCFIFKIYIPSYENLNDIYYEIFGQYARVLRLLGYLPVTHYRKQWSLNSTIQSNASIEINSNIRYQIIVASSQISWRIRGKISFDWQEMSWVCFYEICVNIGPSVIQQILHLLHRVLINAWQKSFLVPFMFAFLMVFRRKQHEVWNASWTSRQSALSVFTRSLNCSIFKFQTTFWEL